MRPEATLTLGYGNDLGTSSNYQKTPAILADMTHYSLGNEKRNMVTGTMAATLPHPPHSERPRVPPAGQQPPFGPGSVTSERSPPSMSGTGAAPFRFGFVTARIASAPALSVFIRVVSAFLAALLLAGGFRA